VGLVPIAGTHPLASNNQFLPGERDFRGCGFISARLETSWMQLTISLAILCICID